MSDHPKIRNVLHPVADVSAATAFYRGAFHLDTKFIDGDRYAALTCGDVTLALVGPEEDVTGGVVAASFMVESVASTLAAVQELGGSVILAPHDGPHETRAVIADPWGNAIVVYDTAFGT
ncbi:VOC family protein [Nocardioides sp. NPDC127514]|uniref:VOC family protein n=1 Tax=unclassified Nocardioides TaxID=2615069 RepID=UPI00332AC6B9